MSIQFRILTPEQATPAGLLGPYQYAVAVNENEEVVSICSFRLDKRATLCDSCTGHCAMGGIVWTRPDYQSQGIFTNLHNYLKAELGVDRVYVHNNNPSNVLIARIYGLAIPPEDEYPPDPQNVAEEFVRVSEMAERVVF